MSAVTTRGQMGVLIVLGTADENANGPAEARWAQVPAEQTAQGAQRTSQPPQFRGSETNA